MYIANYVHNINEGARFCERYGISCRVIQDANGEEKLDVIDPPLAYNETFKAMENAAGKLENFCTDHPNCFLNDDGILIVTFSIYDGELTEADRKKLRRMGYDLRESGFDLYGFGTKTFVMAELISPLE